MDASSIAVVFPLKGLSTWVRILKKFSELKTLSRYYNFILPSALRVVMKEIVVRGSKNDEEWSQALRSKTREWLMLHTILTSRVAFTPQPKMVQLTYNEQLTLSLQLDDVDSALMKTMYQLVSDFTDTSVPEKTEYSLVIGILVSKIPEDALKDVQSEVKGLIEFVMEMFRGEGNNLLLHPAQLVMLRSDWTYTPWNGMLSLPVPTQPTATSSSDRFTGSTSRSPPAVIQSPEEREVSVAAEKEIEKMD